MFPEDTVLKECGDSIAQVRLGLNMTQKELAYESGVSIATVQRVESGASIQFLKLIRIMRVLGLLDKFTSVFTVKSESPLDKLKRREKTRQRASSKGKNISEKDDWAWGDES